MVVEDDRIDIELARMGDLRHGTRTAVGGDDERNALGVKFVDGGGADATVPEEMADERRVGGGGEIAFRLPAAQAPAAARRNRRLEFGNRCRCRREIRCHRLSALIVGGGRARSEGRAALVCGYDAVHGVELSIDAITLSASASWSDVTFERSL